MLKFNVNPNKAQQINGKPLIITLFKIQSCQEHVAKSQLKNTFCTQLHAF